MWQMIWGGSIFIFELFFNINEIKYKGSLKFKNELCFTIYIKIFPWFFSFTLLDFFSNNIK